MEIVGGASSSLFSLGRRRDKHCVVQRIDHTPLYFDVTIKNINGIEPFRPANSSSGDGGLDSQCIYFVVLWLENPAAACSSSIGDYGKARETHKRITESSVMNVRWWTPQRFEFELDPAVFEWERLKLEVVRIGFGDEIGTSQGKRVVGRASIQIKKAVVVGQRSRSYQLDLVRTWSTKGGSFECRREGRISMDMKVSREYRFKS